RSRNGGASDLMSGMNAGITAKEQPDGTLLASQVRTFPPSSGLTNAGQRPMDGGNIMTNATVDTVSANGFTASFPGGDVRVTLATVIQFLISEVPSLKTPSSRPPSQASSSFSIAFKVSRSSSSSTMGWLRPPEATMATRLSLSQLSMAFRMPRPRSQQRLATGE